MAAKQFSENSSHETLSAYHGNKEFVGCIGSNKKMFRRRDPEIKIDEHLPESLRWLLDVSPVPKGSDAKCAETGVCRMMNFDGVSCGALKGKCALLPLEYHEIAKEEAKVLEPIKVALMQTDNKSRAAGEDWVFEGDEVAEVLE